jgi:hypothetical protein
MDIKARLEKINENFPVVEYLNERGMLNNHLFRFTGSPGGMQEYLSINYSTVTPSSSPGIVRCEDDAEVDLFLTLLEGRVSDPSTPFDYQKVLEASNKVYYEGLRDAVSHHCEDRDPENDFPLKDGEVPYWVLEGLGVPDDSTLLYTAGWSDLYGSYWDIPEPDGDNAASLLFHIQGDVGGESHVELGSGDDVENWWGIEEGSLEWFLWAQLFCHSCNLAREHPKYAYVRYDIMGGVWLTPDPENLKSLKSVIKKYDFDSYYQQEPGEALHNWMLAVRKKLVEDDRGYYDDDMIEEFNVLAAEYLPGQQIELVEL